MSQIRFQLGDATDLRFAVSPLFETVRSLYPLADPGRYWVHRPWVDEAQSLLRDARLAGQVDLLRGFARPGSWLPDFLTPRPDRPAMGIEDELAVLAATPAEVVVADLAAVTVRRPPTPMTAATRANPEAVLPRLVDAVRAWHRAAILPYWPRMRALLDADIAYRSRRLAEGGTGRLVDTLHPTVRWVRDRVVAHDPWGLDVDLRGRGITLLPSVFVDRRVLWTVRPESPPLAVYPVRAVATLWRRPEPAGSALAGVLGESRARLLALLRDPATTTALAHRTGLSPAAVSQHLRALHAAGLVTRTQDGRSVRYLTTEPGRLLLRINQPDEADRSG